MTSIVEAAEGSVSLPPLRRTFSFLREQSAQFGLLHEEPAGEGWLTLAELLVPTRPELARLAQAYGAEHKLPGRTAPALNVFGGYAYALVAIVAACYLAQKRVPLCEPDETSVRFDAEGHVNGLAFGSNRFAALDDDPDARHPDCEPFASPELLRDRLRAQLVTLVEPLGHAIHATAGVGKPALWAAAADSMAFAFSYVGKALGAEATGAAEATQIGTPGTILHRRKGFIPIEHCGLEHHLVDRVGCCLFYKAPEGRYCSSCPHRPLEERITLIKNWLETQSAHAA